MKNKQMEEWLDVLNYWMVRKFEAIIDSLYEQINKD